MFERKMVVFVAVRGERKGGKRKKPFFNSTGIILSGNILCISYCSKSKKKNWRLRGCWRGFFCVNSDFFGEKIEIA